MASPPAHTVVISPGSTNEVAVALNVILDVILDRKRNDSGSWDHDDFLPDREGPWRNVRPEGVERLISVFGVAPVNEDVVRRALMLAWPDFENAVCAAAAEASGCQTIVTRDPTGYPDAPLLVVDPAAALIWLKG